MRYSLTLKNSCLWTVMLVKTLESPLDRKEIKQVNPKRNQFPECSLEGLMPKLKLWYFGHLIWRADSLEKTLPGAGKDWRQKEKGTTEDEMIGWHHHLEGHEFEQALGDGEGQGSLVWGSPWGCKELDTTEWLNLLTEYIITLEI